MSIANIDLILETLVDVGRQERDPAMLSEKVRQSLAVSICAKLRGHHHDLSVLSLDPRVENRVLGQANAATTDSLIGADPRLAEQILRALAPLIDSMLRQGRSPVLLCAGPIRRLMARLTLRTMPQLSVISVDEIPMRIALSSFGVVKIPELESIETGM